MLAIADICRIVESGSHEGLLKQNAAYAALWKLQTGEAV